MTAWQYLAGAGLVAALGPLHPRAAVASDGPAGGRVGGGLHAGDHLTGDARGGRGPRHGYRGACAPTVSRGRPPVRRRPWCGPRPARRYGVCPARARRRRAWSGSGC